MNSPPKDITPIHQPQSVAKWWVMVGVSLGVLMYTIDSSIVNIALPTLIGDLHTDFATVQWVGLSYVLVVTSLVLGAARLGDICGKKPLYLGGLILFTASSLLCAWAPSIEILIGAMALGGSLFLIPFFLQLVLHYSIEKIGLLMAAIPVIGGLVSPLAGNLTDRFGTRSIMLIGLILMTIGCVAVSTLDAQMRDADYLLRVVPLGLGWGIFQSPNNSAILSAVPPQRLGIASGLLSLTRTLGQTTGLPLFAAIFTTSALAGTKLQDVTLAPPGAIVEGFQRTFQVAGLTVAIAAGLTLVLWRLESNRDL
jgi:MFS family permease